MLSVVFLQFSLQFVQLLIDFLPHLLFLFPVEAYVACLVLDAVSLDKAGQRIGYAGEYGGVAVTFALLALFPCRFHLRSRVGSRLLAVGSFLFKLVFVDNLPGSIDGHIRMCHAPSCPVDEVVAEHEFV